MYRYLNVDAIDVDADDRRNEAILDAHHALLFNVALIVSTTKDTK